jgi:CxxC-x17-CxxC domain-containing protein
MYPPEQDIVVYCQPCWWADNWDGTEYSMEYDPTRPFLEQVRVLNNKTPHVALETTYLTLKDCEYCNAIAYGKNCMLATWADYCENVCFSSLINGVKDSSDCLRMSDSELCYESMGQNKGYRVFYSEECDSSTDVWFSRNLSGCINCVGCVNMRGASYCIFNEKYSKEDYFEKVKELKLDTRSGIEAFQKQIPEFFKKFPYREYSGNTLNVNVTGEYTYQSKNSKNMYISSGTEDCTNCQFITVAPARDCMDYSGWGNNAELIYESANVGDGVSNSKFSVYCFPDVTETEYSMWCIGAKHNFGCVNLKRKKYCILNKEYSKEEYEKLKAEIIADMRVRPYMDERGKSYLYGEFFPPEFSAFAYNTSNASKFFPKTEQEALTGGYFWHNELEQQVEATTTGDALPETIDEVTDAVMQEAIACTTCSRKYRIASLELSILRKLHMPLPDRCPKCREASRFAQMNPPRLYERTCANCNKPITTAFAPDRSETVYCVECYQKEIH